MNILFLLLKFISVWLIVGGVCTAITVLHDVFIEKIKIRPVEIKGMIVMTLMGFVSVPVIIYFFCQEYQEKRQWKMRRGKRK